MQVQPNKEGIQDVIHFYSYSIIVYLLVIRYTYAKKTFKNIYIYIYIYFLNLDFHFSSFYPQMWEFSGFFFAIPGNCCQTQWLFAQVGPRPLHNYYKSIQNLTSIIAPVGTIHLIRRIDSQSSCVIQDYHTFCFLRVQY